jgi:antitoxin ParD1/3/4
MIAASSLFPGGRDMAKSRGTVNISLPASLSKFVRRRMAQKGFENTSEFFRQLIREEQRRAEDEKLEPLIMQGLMSGEPVEVTDEWWDKLRRDVAAGARRRKSA